MLVKFDSKAGSITMFGDVGVKLLRMMGQSGALPGAMLAKDIPAALQRLRQALSGERDPVAKKDDDDKEPQVGMRQRAFPLIDLLERSAAQGADLVWEDEAKPVM